MQLGRLVLIVILLALVAVPVFAVPFEDFDTHTGAIDWTHSWPGNWLEAIDTWHVNIGFPDGSGNPGKAITVTEKDHVGSMVHGWINPPLDCSAYSTLEFDAKINTNNFTGYSIWLTTNGNYGVLCKAIPFTQSGTVNFQHFKINISGIPNQNALVGIRVDLNRTGQSAGQTITLDNFELTNNPADLTPYELVIDAFSYATFADMYEEGGTKPWNKAYLLAPSLSSDKVGEFTVTSTAISAYARRNSSWPDQSPVDLGDYKSIVFDAKVSKGTGAVRYPPAPIGFSLTANGAGGVTYSRYYAPSAYDTWQTFSINISDPYRVDQLQTLLFYINRCGLNDTGQKLQIDNIRASKQPADPVPATNPIIDDFENGDIKWWYYSSYHTGYFGTTAALTNDAASGQHALKITNNIQPPEFTGNASAYCRKTIQQNWNGYNTVSFDAKMANSSTSEGFSFTPRISGGGYVTYQFWPTNSWRTYKFDISNISTAGKSEVIGILFYMNKANELLTSQNGRQELYVDNIRLSNEPATETYTTVAAAKAGRGSGSVVINGAVVTGMLFETYPDRVNPTYFFMRPGGWHNVFFIEDTEGTSDRASGIPVVWDSSMVSAGDKVNVAGELRLEKGNRVIYATTVDPVGGENHAKPIMVTNKNCAGLATSNLDTQGMLVTITGKAIAYKTDVLYRSWLYIDDGSNLKADVVDSEQMYGVKVLDAGGLFADFVGKQVCATGYAMNDQGFSLVNNKFQLTNQYSRALWPKIEITDAVRVIEP